MYCLIPCKMWSSSPWILRNHLAAQCNKNICTNRLVCHWWLIPLKTLGILCEKKKKKTWLHDIIYSLIKGLEELVTVLGLTFLLLFHPCSCADLACPWKHLVDEFPVPGARALPVLCLPFHSPLQPPSSFCISRTSTISFWTEGEDSLPIFPLWQQRAYKDNPSLALKN